MCFFIAPNARSPACAAPAEDKQSLPLTVTETVLSCLRLAGTYSSHSLVYLAHKQQVRKSRGYQEVKDPAHVPSGTLPCYPRRLSACCTMHINTFSESCRPFCGTARQGCVLPDTQRRIGRAREVGMCCRKVRNVMNHSQRGQNTRT
jgi:hypothetical protein